MICRDLRRKSWVGTVAQILLCSLPVTFSECPRGGPENRICSSRGLCNVYSRCQCSDGFEGPSCELRVCHSGEAWSSPYGLRGPYEYDFRGVHGDAVCSSRGICDRATGHCECQYGFEGAACERMSCPKGTGARGPGVTCSGHGLCTNLERLAKEFNYWDFPRPLYTTPWDKEKVYGCLCDVGFSGYDCSLRECSVGDDPLARNRGRPANFKNSGFQAWRDTVTTTHKTRNTAHTGGLSLEYSSEDRQWGEGLDLVGQPLVNEKQLVYCQASKADSDSWVVEGARGLSPGSEGWFTLRLGTAVSGPIDVRSSSVEMERALSHLKVGPIRVTFSNPSAGGLCAGAGGGPSSSSLKRQEDNVAVVEFLHLTGRDMRMQDFTGGDASVPPLELEESKLGSTGFVTLAHGAQGRLLDQKAVPTNRVAKPCSGRGLCDQRGGGRGGDEEGGGSCSCQRGFVASDGYAFGSHGGVRFQEDYKGGAKFGPPEGTPTQAYDDCGALDPGVYPNKGYSVDRAAGEHGGVAGTSGVVASGGSEALGSSLGSKSSRSTFASSGGSGEQALVLGGSGVELSSAEDYEWGACPSGGGLGLKCSGHGVCSGQPVWECFCEQGWEGYDCSQRACARARSWFDFPRSNEEAHWSLVECGGRGHCDRSLGICTCEPGFRGAACDVLDCPVGRVYKPSPPAKRTHPLGEELPPAQTQTHAQPSSAGESSLSSSSLRGASGTAAAAAAAAGAGHGTGGGRSLLSPQASSKRSDAPPGFGDDDVASTGHALSYDADVAGVGQRLSYGVQASVARAGLVGGLGERADRWELPKAGTYCSGHGVCLSQAQHAERALWWRAETDLAYGDRVESRTRYSGEFWDADRIMGCLCDDGWMAYDCSLQTCPFGDDPSSYNQQHEVQVLRCLTGGGGTSKSTSTAAASAASALVGGSGLASEVAGEAAALASGTFTLRFRRFGSDAAPTIPIPHNATAADVKATLEQLSSLGSVSVELFNVELTNSTTEEALLEGGSVCAPRAPNDALLVLPSELPAPGFLFAAEEKGETGNDDTHGSSSSSSGNQGSVATLSLSLSAHPAEDVRVTLVARRASDGNLASASELAVWPANFTFFALKESGGGHVRGASPSSSTLSSRFNVSAGLHGAVGASGQGLALGGALYYVEATLSTLAGVVGGDGFVTFAAQPWGGVAVNGGGGGRSVFPVRVFQGSSHLATPDLSAPHGNATLLPGATTSPFTLGLSQAAPRFASDDDDGGGGNGTVVAKTLVVTLGASSLGSGVDLVAAGLVSFQPPTVTLSSENPFANFTVAAAANALSSPTSTRDLLAVTYAISGALATTFAAPSQTGLLGERLVLQRSDSGSVETEAAAGSVVNLAAAAVVLPPSVLPALYRSSPSTPLALRLSSLPPAGTALTVTPVCVSATATASVASCSFTPAVLTFNATDASLEQALVVNGGGVGSVNVTYSLGGTAVSLYSVAAPPAGLGGGGGAAGTGVAWWSAEVHRAPLLRVTFNTESGNLPPLVPNAAGLKGGGGAAGDAATGASSAVAGAGGHVEVYADGAVALGATAESRAAAAAAAEGVEGFGSGAKNLFTSVKGTTESAECSDRGVCDRRSGTCQCFDGYRSSDGNGREGTRGDCGFLVPQTAPLWKAQAPPNDVLAKT